jgi:hypothetical protein
VPLAESGERRLLQVRWLAQALHDQLVDRVFDGIVADFVPWTGHAHAVRGVAVRIRSLGSRMIWNAAGTLLT